MVAFIGIWALFSAFVFEPYVLPSPWAVAVEMWNLVITGEVFINFKSFVKTMAGWAMALAIGIPIGLAMGRYRYACFFHDFVYLFANVPLLVYAVIALILESALGVRRSWSLSRPSPGSPSTWPPGWSRWTEGCSP